MCKHYADGFNALSFSSLFLCTYVLCAVYFYNFGMPDFGVSSLVGLIDAVKVIAFAVREGRVAVHCHAGLGRTGRIKNIFHVSKYCMLQIGHI